MNRTDNCAAEKALLFDIYYGDDTRPWEDITGESDIGNMLLRWFCRRVLSSGLLFPKVPADRVDALCRTYALGSAMAAHTNSMRTAEICADAAVSIVKMFDTSTIGGREFAARRADSVRAYQQTFLDSAGGVADRISAMELAYMYMCDIPRDAAHARELTAICYDWMYWFSKLSIEKIAAQRADIEDCPVPAEG